MIECKDGVFDDGLVSLLEDVKNYYYSNVELAAGSLEEAKPQLVLSAKQLATKHNDSQLALDLITGVYKELCRLIKWNEDLRNAR